MNIGIFTDTYSPNVNGVVSSILTLQNELTALGHKVYIFTTTHPKAKDDYPFTYRIPSMPFVFLKDFRVGLVYSHKTILKIKKLKLDLILTQTEFSLGLFGKLVSKQLHIPIIHTYHTMYEEYMHYVSKGVELSPELARKYSKKFCNGVDGVVAPTQKTEHFLRKYGVTTPIRVIPTGIDFSPFDSANYDATEIATLRQSLSLKEDAPVVLFVGRVAKEKSIDVVIQQMQKVLETLPNARLLIVGDGPARKELTELALSLKIDHAVIFAGMQPWNTIGKFYQLGDVFVSASVTETQGLTFAEAMAASLPVVAKNDECVQGLIEPGKSGMLFDEEGELAPILINLLQDPELCTAISTEALLAIEPLSARTFGLNATMYYDEILSLYHDKVEQKEEQRKNKKAAKKVFFHSPK